MNQICTRTPLIEPNHTTQEICDLQTSLGRREPGHAPGTSHEEK